MSINSLELKLREVESSARNYAVSKLGNAYIDHIVSKQTEERAELVCRLAKTTWFRNTALHVKVELLVLPENHNGFLRDLADRPELIGNVQVLSLEKLARGNFGLIPVFRVRKANGEELSYEYMSWRHGPHSGVKGLVLIETETGVSHFVLLRGDTFATGQYEFVSVGGYAEVGEQGHDGQRSNFLREMREELGDENLELVGDPVYLGRLATDPGMTNNRPGLFVCVVKNYDPGINSGIVENNPDGAELPLRPVVHPLSQLRELVMKNDDGYFLAAVARGWAAGIIPYK